MSKDRDPLVQKFFDIVDDVIVRYHETLTLERLQRLMDLRKEIEDESNDK